MRIVQFEIPRQGRRVGIVEGDLVYDLTAFDSGLDRTYSLFTAACRQDMLVEELCRQLQTRTSLSTLSYDALLAAEPFQDEPFLHPPIDHSDSSRVLVTGTGLTHTGSMQSRDEMHAEESNDESTEKEAQTDSARMFEMGQKGGKPSSGQRGAAPEWFYKGNGRVLRGPRQSLDIPAFALDGGEEPELAGCYIIDSAGVPRRLGFTLGNEWSDHETERINYLYLAPSKLRTCAIGPELVTDFDFQELSLTCSVWRNGESIYDSGDLFSGENYMCHSLANCEDHHFKYPQHRQPGDVHVHFFGTSRLSYGTRDWKFQENDEIRIAAPGFSAELVNRVRIDTSAASPIVTRPG